MIQLPGNGEFTQNKQTWAGYLTGVIIGGRLHNIVAPLLECLLALNQSRFQQSTKKL